MKKLAPKTCKNEGAWAKEMFNITLDLRRIQSKDVQQQYLNFIIHGMTDFFGKTELEGRFASLEDSNNSKMNKQKCEIMNNHLHKTCLFFNNFHSKTLRSYLLKAVLHDNVNTDRRFGTKVFATSTAQNVITKLFCSSPEEFQNLLIENVLKQLEKANIDKPSNIENCINNE
ncbi:MAG: hypothetical protein ACK5Z5_00600 [Neisseriaceae bacterium]